jgi:hypothetical protein
VIESDWYDVGISVAHPNVRAVKGRTKTGMAYTLIQCGRVLLTQSMVEERLGKVRPAEFRAELVKNTLALSRQLQLPYSDLERQPRGKFLVGILIHGSHEIEQKLVSFADLAFPTLDGRYVGHIDLYAENRELVLARQSYFQEAIETKDEQIPDRAQPKLRRKVENPGGDQQR